MIEYIKFWIAKELAGPAIYLGIIFAVFVGVFAVAFVYALAHALRKKWQVWRGAQKP